MNFCKPLKPVLTKKDEPQPTTGGGSMVKNVSAKDLKLMRNSLRPVGGSPLGMRYSPGQGVPAEDDSLYPDEKKKKILQRPRVFRCL